MNYSTLKISDEIIFKKIGSDYYISTTKFKDYILENISSEIFDLLCQNHTVNQIIDLLQEKYQVSKEIIQNDVNKFIDKLMNFKILEYENQDKTCENKDAFKESREILITPNEDINLFSKARKNNIPINVDLHITYQCNLTCKHCYAKNQDDTNNCGKLTLEEIKRTFDQLDQMGTFYLRISGGEPFIHPQFLEILDYAYRKKFAVSIITNGTLLNDYIISKLKEFKIRSLTFSLHGENSSIHDSFVGVQGSFEKLKRNAFKCKESGIPVNFSWTVTNDSIDSLQNIKKLSDELKIPIGITTRIVPQMDGDLNPKQYRLTSEQLIKFIKENNYKIEPLKCTIGTKLQIDSNGAVHPCLFVNHSIGNVRESCIEDIWNNLIKNRYKWYEDFHTKPDECKNCLYQDNCHRCPGIAKIENGRSNACSESAKWEAKAFYLANNSEAEKGDN